jgi:hypothetical protein
MPPTSALRIMKARRSMPARLVRMHLARGHEILLFAIIGTHKSFLFHYSGPKLLLSKLHTAGYAREGRRLTDWKHGI